MRFIFFIGGLCGLSAAVAIVPAMARAQADAVTGLVEVSPATMGVLSEAVVPGPADASGVLAFVETPLSDPARVRDGAQPLAPVSPLAPATSLRPHPRDTWAVPVARWDGHPNGPRWTAAVLAALRGPGAPLLDVVPRDIHAWCPGYASATPAQRAAFWTGLISTLAWHESTHDPRAVGGGGQWFGLVQIAPGTARWRDCDADSSSELMSGVANLRCGIRIMAATVRRDGVVAEGMRGVAADWGPFHSARKREDMRRWVRGQPYCAAPPPQMRPVMRPAGLVSASAEGRRALAGASGAAGAVRRPEPRPAALRAQRGG